jgi:hypothetical protein
MLATVGLLLIDAGLPPCDHGPMEDASAEIEEVDELVRQFRPFLRDLATPLTRSVDRELFGQYDTPRRLEELFPERGLVLVDRYTEEKANPLETCLAKITGTCLVLVLYRHFAELRRSGSSWYSGESWYVTMQHLSTAEALARYGFAGCTEKIREALGGGDRARDPGREGS